MSKTIEFEVHGDLLVLVYSPRDGTEWLYEKLKLEAHTIQNTFAVKKRDLFKANKNKTRKFSISDSEFEIKFKLAKLKDSYWNFSKRVLGIEFTLLIHKGVRLDASCFTAVRNRSIFRSIGGVTQAKRVVIGGPQGADNALSEDEFKELLSKFPNTYELDKYVRARIASVLKERFIISDDYERSYHNYLNTKITENSTPKLFHDIDEYELEKYKDLHTHLVAMLAAESGYSEKDWQNEIVKFILLLFPKYIYFFTEAPVLDKQYDKVRALDFLLVDSTGNIDIVEIKKPFEKGLVTQSGYRDNYIPLRELSGTIMQIEKYIFHLMKSGRRGEKMFNSKYGDQLHKGFKIKISNPKGMIISGRTDALSEDQLRDFEIIRRKYQNIIDIISYDDLLARLENTIRKLQKTI